MTPELLIKEKEQSYPTDTIEVLFHGIFSDMSLLVGPSPPKYVLEPIVQNLN